MNYYLGIDLGTTSVKAVAFSNKAEVLLQYSVASETCHPQPEYSEQNPDAILKAVIECIDTVHAKMLPREPAFISFCAAMHSLIAVDEYCKPLTQSILWSDNRSAAEAKMLHQSGEAKRLYERSGVPVHAMSPLCKLLWLKKNQPDIFNHACKFIGIKEYVFYHITGKFVIDTNIASATGLLNIHTLQWDDEIIKMIGLRGDQLSEVADVKYSSFIHSSNKINLPSSVPFIIGGSDGALANLGMDVLDKNTMAVTIGTSAAARVTIQQPQTDDKMQAFCYHLHNNLYIKGGASNNGAIVLQWLKESILQTNDSYDEMAGQAATILPGADGLIFLPYLSGERAPLWNTNAKAVYFGLTQQHTKAHLIRAAMEGVMYNVYAIAETLNKEKNISRIYAGGGFADSELWVQMLADVCNLPVTVLETKESSALGAVIIGAEATKSNLTSRAHHLTQYLPNLSASKMYRLQYQRFRQLLQLCSKMY